MYTAKRIIVQRNTSKSTGAEVHSEHNILLEASKTELSWTESYRGRGGY